MKKCSVSRGMAVTNACTQVPVSQIRSISFLLPTCSFERPLPSYSRDSVLNFALKDWFSIFELYKNAITQYVMSLASFAQHVFGFLPCFTYIKKGKIYDSTVL